MDIIKKNRILFYLVVILITVNFLTIALFWFLHSIQTSEKKLRPQQNDKQLIAFFEKELSFDKEQSDSLQKIIADYNHNVKSMKEQIRILHNNLNYEVINNTSLNEVDSAFTVLGYKKAELDKYSYRFFTDLRSICNEKQKNKFDYLIKDIMKLINKSNQKK